MSWKEEEWNNIDIISENFISRYQRHGTVYICTEEKNDSYCFIKNMLDMLNINNTFLKKGNVNINNYPLLITDGADNEYLSKRGYEENCSFFVVYRSLRSDFFRKELPLVYYKLFNKIYIHSVQISLTSRCILKCKDCCNGCNKWDKKDKSNDISWEDAKETIDNTFKNIDYIGEIILVGGESLLCQSAIREILKYLFNKYRTRFNEIIIYTNFGVPILDITLKSFIEYSSMLRLMVSQYTKIVPKISKNFFYNLLLCKKNNIKYDILEYRGESWIDYKMFLVSHSDEEANMIAYQCYLHFYSRCQEIHKDKLYYCCQGYVNSKNSNIDINKIQYLDLKKIKNDPVYSIKFIRGLNEDRDLFLCRHCNGVGKNIIAAMQES